jgi:multiple sugar transport system ATP-binding protein
VLGLDPLLERKPAALSGGQRQRVAMGRAMVREPHAFLMDEPLSNLDAKLRVQMRSELARLRDRLHTTTIYVTHDQVEAMTLGDRVAVMRDGVVQQLDRPQALYAQPANVFVAAFIGSPSMNLFEARVDGPDVRFAGQRVPVSPPHDLRGYDGRTVVLGIRPSDFEDASVWRDDAHPRLPVKVEVSEELGAEVNLIFSLDATPAATDIIAQTTEESPDSLTVPFAAAEGRTVCTACVDARSAARAGDAVELAMAPERFHFFDHDTGAAIGQPSPVAAGA